MSDLVIGAIVGAVITSLLAPYLNQSSERRKIRSKVLDAISGIETSRWAAASSHKEFRDSVRALRSTALIARTNRELTEYYIYLVSVCRFNSERDQEDSPEQEFKGSIPSELSDFARETGDALVTCLWHPVRSRPFRSNKLSDIEGRVEKFKKKNEKFYKGTRSSSVYWEVKY